MNGVVMTGTVLFGSFTKLATVKRKKKKKGCSFWDNTKLKQNMDEFNILFIYIVYGVSFGTQLTITR